MTDQEDKTVEEEAKPLPIELSAYEGDEVTFRVYRSAKVEDRFELHMYWHEYDYTGPGSKPDKIKGLTIDDLAALGSACMEALDPGDEDELEEDVDHPDEDHCDDDESADNVGGE